MTARRFAPPSPPTSPDGATPGDTRITHTDLLRCGMAAEESRVYWENARPGAPAPALAQAAFEERWFDAFTSDFRARRRAHPEPTIDRSLILIGRAGALHPFYRSSALLKHIDGKTRNLPVVLLYPGERPDPTGSGLSFMGELPSDRDYRPRIYS